MDVGQVNGNSTGEIKAPYKPREEAGESFKLNSQEIAESIWNDDYSEGAARLKVGLGAIGVGTAITLGSGGSAVGLGGLTVGVGIGDVALGAWKLSDNSWEAQSRIKSDGLLQTREEAIQSRYGTSDQRYKAFKEIYTN